ncbi:MAG TPA: YARHG domain-containing protein, partial [Puia sp.]
KRWANKKIDDFTLQVDMGEFVDFRIRNSFFQHASEWTLDSLAKGRDLKGSKEEPAASEFFVRKGMISFAKKDFKPMGELSITRYSMYHFQAPETFDSKRDYLPFSVELEDNISPPANELSRKILHNLPFARRGYVFKSPELTAYFGKQPWYWPDPAYTPDATTLTKKEQEWLAKSR